MRPVDIPNRIVGRESRKEDRDIKYSVSTAKLNNAIHDRRQILNYIFACRNLQNSQSMHAWHYFANFVILYANFHAFAVLATNIYLKAWMMHPNKTYVCLCFRGLSLMMQHSNYHCIQWFILSILQGWIISVNTAMYVTYYCMQLINLSSPCKLRWTRKHNKVRLLLQGPVKIHTKRKKRLKMYKVRSSKILKSIYINPLTKEPLYMMSQLVSEFWRTTKNLFIAACYSYRSLTLACCQNAGGIWSQRRRIMSS